MNHVLINPAILGPPRGYTNGILAAPGRVLFIAGQIAWDETQTIVSSSFSEQFSRALENVCTVLAAAGGRPEHLCRLTIFVTDRQAYLAQRSEIGIAYRRIVGAYYPAMALVEVAALLEEDALVEIEATAVVPDPNVAAGPAAEERP